MVTQGGMHQQPSTARNLSFSQSGSLSMAPSLGPLPSLSFSPFEYTLGQLMESNHPYPKAVPVLTDEYPSKRGLERKEEDVREMDWSGRSRSKTVRMSPLPPDIDGGGAARRPGAQPVFRVFLHGSCTTRPVNT